LFAYEPLRPAVLPEPALPARPRPDYALRAIPVVLLAGLLASSAVLARWSPPMLGIHRAAAPAVDLRPTPYDYAPSPLREQVLERREAGLRLPSTSSILLEEQAEADALQLQQERDLVARYFGEIKSRDADIAKLSQTVDANQASLTKLALQLGLPNERLAAPPPAEKGVGGPTAGDVSALADSTSPMAVTGAMVKSVQDLTNLVSRYLSLPCPLPAGDARCGQAVDHARAQLARGHGLDVNKPDASPTLSINVAQPFGPTDVDLEPLVLVGGQMVHFHDGVDLAANYDEPVMAAASGVVVFAGEAPSGALTVEIAHAGGIHTVYMHEEQLLVKQGQQVQKGQIIGLVGATGIATGPHVHFMIKNAAGTPIDALPWIR